MPIVEKTIDAPTHAANSSAGTDALQNLVRELEAECNRLKQALAASEAERKRYHQAFLDQARAAREFEDRDVDALKAMSAGQVELIE